MKALRYILIFATVSLVGLFNTASARSNISVSIGGVHKGHRSDYRANYKQDSHKSIHRYRDHIESRLF